MSSRPKLSSKKKQAHTDQILNVHGAIDAVEQPEYLPRSEGYFSRAFDSSPTCLTIARLADGKFEYVNESFLQLSEYQREDVIGKSGAELDLFPDLTQMARFRQILIESKQVRNFETSIRTKKGDIKHVLFSADIILSNAQPCSLTTMVDITDRVRAEKQVVQMKRLYATLSQVNQTIVRVKSDGELYQSICDVALKFGELTLAWIGLLDEATGDLQPVAASGMGVDIARWPFPIMNLYQNPPINGVIAEAIHTSNTMTSNDVQTDVRTEALHNKLQEYGFRSLAAVPFQLRGKTIGVLVMISVEPGIFDTDEKLKLCDEMGMDISFALDTMATRAEQVRAEALSRENEHKFATLFMKAPYAIQLSRLPDGSIVEVNEEWENLVGYSRQEAAGKTSAELDLYPDPQIRERSIAKFERKDLAHNIETVLRRKSGDLCTVLLSTDMLEIAGTEYLITTAQDITERKQAEEKLRYQAHLLENVSDAIVASDEKYIVTSWNRAAERTYGWKSEEVLGKRGVDFLQTQFTGIDAEEMRNQIAQSGRFFGEATQLRKDGTRIPVEVASIVLRDKSEKITGYVSVNRDITRRRRAEQALRESEKRLRVLLQISQAMTAPFELNTILQTIVDNATQLMSLDSGAFYLLEQDELFLATTIPPLPPGFPDEFRRTALAEHPHIQDAIANGAAVILPDTATSDLTRAEREISESRGLRSILYLPLMIGRKAIGVLILASVNAIRTFSEEEINLYHGFAGQAAQIVENVRLYESTRNYAAELEIQVAERKRAEEKTQQQLKRLNAMHMIDTAISSSFDLHYVLQIVLEQVLSQLGVDAGTVLLLSPETRKVEYAASLGFHSNICEHTSLNIGEGYASRAVQEHKTIHVSACMEENGRLASSLHWEGENFVDYYGLPLIVKGEAKGVLEIYHRSILHPDSEWHNFAETLASQAAIMIEHAQLFSELQQSNLELLAAYDATIEGWSRAMDLRDRETEGHTQRVTSLAVALARHMGIPEAQIVHIRRGALLHDIGKLGIPDKILLKSGALTNEEWMFMRKHPQLAYEMLADVHYLKPALDIPHCHHEKWDGSGYPQGLKGEEIPLAARIFAVVDVWDAITSARPYRKAWSHDEALSHLREQSGQYFDPKIVQAFLNMIERM